MIEVELKYVVKDKNELRNKLKNNGFTLVGNSKQEDNYYTDPAGEFLKNKTCLRLRVKEGKTLLTFKPETVNGNSHKEETEVEIANHESMEAILKALGYKKTVSFVKEHETYKKNEIEACIDTIKEIGTYVELEIMTNDTINALKKIKQTAKELELTNEEKRNYRDLVIEKKENAK